MKGERSGPVRQGFREFFYGFSAIPQKLLLAVLTGIFSGLVAVAFRLGVAWAGRVRTENPRLLLLLPLAGLLIFGLYRLFRYKTEPGVDTIFSSIHSGKKLRFPQAPLVFSASILTHLCGGSAGREGAALELGACVGAKTARFLRWQRKFKKISILCGMAGAFSALFGTPIAAFFFVTEITGPKVFHYRGGFFVLVSSITAFAVLPFFGLLGTNAVLPVLPVLDSAHFFPILLLTVICAMTGFFFCLMMWMIPAIFARLIPNGYLRIVAGALVILLLTGAVGSTRYNGLGTEILAGSFTGAVLLADPIRKTILTGITLGSGFKGGDLIPALITGASAGSLAAAWLGLPVSFGAGIGLVTLFCVVTRCRLAAIFIGAELFGTPFALISIPLLMFAYLFSGTWSLFRVRGRQ